MFSNGAYYAALKWILKNKSPSTLWANSTVSDSPEEYSYVPDPIRDVVASIYRDIKADCK